MAVEELAKAGGVESREWWKRWKAWVKDGDASGGGGNAGT